MQEPKNLQEIIRKSVEIVKSENILFSSTANLNQNDSNQELLKFNKEIQRSSSSFLKESRVATILKNLNNSKILVFFLFILILGSQAAIIIYINQGYQIYSITNISSIAEASVELLKMSLIARGINLSINNTMPDTSNLESFANTSLNVLNFSSQLNNRGEESQCSQDKTFFNNINEEYNIKAPSVIDKTIVNILQDISQSYKNYENSLNITDDLNFITFNGIISSTTLFTIYNSLIDCILNKISQTNQTVLYLTITSVAICVLSLIILAIIIKDIKKYYISIWKVFCKISKKNLLEIQKNSVERLAETHKKIEFKTNYANLDKIINKSDSKSKDFSIF